MTKPEHTNPNDIFVFGSNLAGRHGMGSAKHAKAYYGAIQGKGVGLQGRSYGIPTKDENLRVMPLPDIKQYVAGFVSFALKHPNLQFHVVAIGCGLANYKPTQIAPFFKGYPPNVHLPQEFLDVL